MNDQNDLTYMASLYMALADKTRLKLLDLMRSGEVCVNDFAGAIGDSQPKISRHLAYLRSAGVVDTRRDGKWVHYSIRWPEDEGARATLAAALNWLGEPASNNGHLRDAPDIYAKPYVNDETYEESHYSAHNELEEFLL